MCQCVCLSFTYLLLLSIPGPFLFGTLFLLLFHSFSFFLYAASFSLTSLPLWRSPIGSRSLWSVLGAWGKESPVKHGAGASKGGGGGGGARGGTHRAGGSSTGALCSGFTLVYYNFTNKNYIYDI